MDSAARDSGAIARYGLYGEAVQRHAADFLHIEDIPSRSRLNGWRIAPHAHPGMMQLVLVEQGTARFTADGRSEELAGPALALVPGGCVHGFRFTADTQGWVLTIAETLLSDPRLAGGLGSLEPLAAVGAAALAGAAAARLGWLMRDLAGKVNRPGRDATLVWLLGLILAELLEVAGEQVEAHSRSDPAPALLRRFRALVEEHYREHWPVERYARALGVSRGRLNRVCRSIAGDSPGDMLLDRLLLEATRYLAYTSAPAAQVAYQLGFEDPAYFSRFFRKRTGVTPIAYRRAGQRSTPLTFPQVRAAV